MLLLGSGRHVGALNAKVSKFEYSRSSPCDHSRKQPALVTTTFVKPRLNCDLNFVMKSSRKRLRPLWNYPTGLFLCCKLSLATTQSLIIINKHFNDFNETAHRANSLKHWP